MTIAVTVLLGCIAGYFLLAVFVPRSRVRWGVSRGAALTISRKGVARTKWSGRKPQMGALSCLGFATFAGGLILPFSLPGLPAGIIPFLGLLLAAVGAALDWLREPPAFTKKGSTHSMGRF